MDTPDEDDLEHLKAQAGSESKDALASSSDEEQSKLPPETETEATKTEAEGQEGEGDAEEGDEEEEDDGSARPHVQGRSSARGAARGRHPWDDLEAFRRSMPGRSNAELSQLYAAACLEHEKELDGGHHIDKHFSALSVIREQLAERAVQDIIRDVLMPLLAHLNPCVQVISALDILSKGAEAVSLTRKVSRTLHAAERRGARGLAGALVQDGIAWNVGASADRVLTPTLKEAPEVILDGTSGRYAAARANQLSAPIRTASIERGRGR